MKLANILSDFGHGNMDVQISVLSALSWRDNLLYGNPNTTQRMESTNQSVAYKVGCGTGAMASTSILVLPQIIALTAMYFMYK